MKKKIVLGDETVKKLMSFKTVFDEIMEEETDFNDYVEVVLSEGIEKMLRDVIPEEHEWDTLRVAFEKDYKFISNVLVDILSRGAEISEEEKKRMKNKMSMYIQ